MSDKNGTRLTGRYALIMAFFWANFAVLSNYASVYLLGHGFDNTGIGLMIAAASLISVLVQPVLGAWADDRRSPSVKVILLIMTGAYLTAASLIPVTADRARVLLILAYVTALMLMQSMAPFTSALGTLSAGAGRRVDFGIARGVGSLAYAVVSFMIGGAVERLGIGLIPAAGIGLYAFLALALFIFPFRKTPVPREVKGGAGFLRRYPGFITVLTAAGFLYASHMMIGNFLYQIILIKGGDSASLGAAHAIAALTELPVMFLFTRLLRRMSAGKWLVLSGCAYLVKCLGTLLVRSVNAFYGVQCLQLLAFAVLAVASVHYVDGLMAPRDAVKGQAFFAVAGTVGTVAGSALGGRLIDLYDVNAMMAAAVAFSAIGAAVMAWGIKKCRRADAGPADTSIK